MTPSYRLFPDYGADPVWAERGMVDLDDLPISSRLRTDLRTWAARWEQLMGQDFRIREKDSHNEWQRAGRRLARDLQRELGDDAVVTYEP
ncbi:hypothetical protein PZ938_03845 [Luteipulveratus sp. YIM 133132]|uniref:hypothetical protein n=1 Tax=Luteipulveratus flavus TaxID=3031728 RepID=UPI0023B138C7|nr:hypothetical protein [Luteipulveratus sp. YIM 133132]MDE9364726.1 hypothetical protein [Luteipulveratus sp. YIM 133132]